MGSTSFYPEEAPVHTATVDAVRRRTAPGDQRPVRRVRRRHRVRHGRRAAARSRRCTRGWRPRTSRRARWCSGRRRDRSTCGTGGSGGTGRPAPAGATRSGRTAARERRGPTGWTIPSCRSPTPTRRPTRAGRAGGCRPRRSGSTPHGVARRRPTPGATRWRPDGRLMANTWQGRFPYRNDGALAGSAPRRSARSRRTGSACST